jgi:4-aminobutyrate aminotransferase-like enzyme
VYLEDMDGNRYIDFTAGGTTAVGYSHPRVVDAVVEQAKMGLDQTDLSIGIVDLRSDLAQEIKSWIPSKLATGKIAFGHSGSDIIERAIRVARFATG